MNKTAVNLLCVWLVVGFTSVAGAADDDAIMEMKALKALMDELPDSTLEKGHTVVEEPAEEAAEEPVKEVIEEAQEEYIVETPEVEQKLERLLSETGTIEESAETPKQEKSFLDEEINKNADEAWGSEDVIEEVTDAVAQDDMADAEEETKEDMDEPSVKKEEADPTIMDLINGEESPVTKEEPAVPAVERIGTAPVVNAPEMVEYREDLSEEISDGIVEINKRIEHMDGVLDQEISELESEIKDLNEPAKEEQTPPYESEY